MERPSKRLRLGLLNEPSPDAELEHARYLNDQSLKSRFESIFDKYSLDFDGIGDEIDLLTGDVLVDNGHLASMANETDTNGNFTLLREVQAGRSLLRAMTAMPEEQDAYFNSPISSEIMMSIEQVVENTSDLVNSQDTTEKGFDSIDCQSEDESSGGSISGSPLNQLPASRTHEQIYGGVSQWLSDSDQDSLFAADVTSGFLRRASTPDSLFQTQVHGEPESSRLSYPNPKPISVASGIDLEITEEAILDRFGPGIGPQVVEIMNKTRETNDRHIEPAWRIPVSLCPPPPMERSPPILMPTQPRELSPNAAISVWGPGQPAPPRLESQKRNSRKELENERCRVGSLSRDEAHDPLQDINQNTKGLSQRLRSPCVETKPMKKSRDTKLKSADTSTAQRQTDFTVDDGSKDAADPTYCAIKRRRRRPRKHTSITRKASLNNAENTEPEHVSNELQISESDRSTVIAGTEDDKDEKDSTVEPEDDGFCVYCQTQFSSKTSIMAHWDRLIKRFRCDQLPHDDPHDMETIRIARGPKRLNIRGARLTLIDFRTLVELHEGAGISFEDIAQSKALRTRKHPSRLREIYDQSRNILMNGDQLQQDWSVQEVQTLQELCRNKLVTLTTLTRRLKGRDVLEIGNRLAAGWLMELKDRPSSAALVQHDKNIAIVADHVLSGSDDEYIDDVSIKSEDDW